MSNTKKLNFTFIKQKQNRIMVLVGTRSKLKHVYWKVKIVMILFGPSYKAFIWFQKA